MRCSNSAGLADPIEVICLTANFSANLAIEVISSDKDYQPISINSNEGLFKSNY
jgi:hypothetical protein